MGSVKVLVTEYVHTTMHSLTRLLKKTGYDVTTTPHTGLEMILEQTNNIDALVIRQLPLTWETLVHLNHCKVVVCLDMTNDHIDKDFARKQGIQISKIPYCLTLENNNILVEAAIEVMRGITGMPLKYPAD